MCMFVCDWAIHARLLCAIQLACNYFFHETAKLPFISHRTDATAPSYRCHVRMNTIYSRSKTERAVYFSWRVCLTLVREDLRSITRDRDVTLFVAVALLFTVSPCFLGNLWSQGSMPPPAPRVTPLVFIGRWVQHSLPQIAGFHRFFLT